MLGDLAQWPIAMVLHDVYDIEGHPRLVEDLGLEDRTILVNAFDTVRRPEQKVERLWQARAAIHWSCASSIGSP